MAVVGSVPEVHERQTFLVRVVVVVVVVLSSGFSSGGCTSLRCVALLSLLGRCLFVCCRGCAVLTGAFLLEEGLVHQGVVAANHFQCLLLRAFHDEATDYHLLQDEVGLVEVEDQIELAHVAEVAIKHLNEVVNDVEHD